MRKIKPLLEKRDILPICFLGILALNFCLILTQIYIVMKQETIEARMGRILVQDSNGKTFVAGNKSKAPSAEAIKYFVQHWLKEQYRFSGKTFDLEGKAIEDRGIELKNGSDVLLVPLNIYDASFAIPAENRYQFLYALIQEWMPQNYFQPQKTTAEFEIREMAEPQLKDKKQNLWVVKVIGQINYINFENKTEFRQFKRTIFLKPTEIPLEDPSEIVNLSERLTHKWRSKGFVVVGME